MLSLKQAQRMVARQRRRLERLFAEYGYAGHPDLDAADEEMTRRTRLYSEAFCRAHEKAVARRIDMTFNSHAEWTTRWKDVEFLAMRLMRL